MRILNIWSLAVAAGAATAFKHGRTKPRDDPTKPRPELTHNSITSKFILEVKEGWSIPTLARQLAPEPGINDTFYKSFDCSDIFNGLVINTKTDNADTLSAHEGVANVWPMKTVPLSSPLDHVKTGPEFRAQNYSIHRWTGVDVLHTQGIRGKGATVAIIDTGVDYTHEALGGCFGPGCKIVGGYDVVGTDWDPHDEHTHPKRPDADPMDLHGHGTHVAGIVAADNEWLIGVAPDAKLLVYKVFPDVPENTDEDILIQAFCDAYSAGADIITASIGRPNGFVDNPWALVASRLVNKGIVVTISAGNEGTTGPFFASSGSSGHGVLAVAAINVTGNPDVKMSDPKAQPVPAIFTTWGPTNDLSIKPDIGAPGYNVVSTLPGNKFGPMSGTSMAAPYVAGIAALYISKHGGRELHGPGFAKRLADRIVSSGRSVTWDTGKVRPDYIAPPFQVGTGLVDALKVLRYDTHLSFEPFALQDSQLFKPQWHADITNLGNKTVTYFFDIEPQAGVQLLDPHYGIKRLYELEPINITPKVTLPKTPLVLKPGETGRAEFSFNQPLGIDDDYLPLYGGKIWVRGSNGEDLSIPYGGAAYDTEKAFDTMFFGEPSVGQSINWTWTFNVDYDSNDYMELSASLNYPCFHLRWDIFGPYWSEEYWSYPPVVGNNNYVGSVAIMRDSDSYFYYDPERMDKDDTIAFPMMRIPRGYVKFWWFGILANGTRIAPGNYTMRFAALRPYGNPNIADHWDVMRMPVRNIQVLPFNSTKSTGS
ncbi:Thermophilic serine proteinase [Cladobotryum mycophilum]|uniref:Thermophilic serine proteinase n=1 Tax=Cladobotryum mycophilum TaxID=491253 RepID=A0ABR0SVC3_9HYPO